MAQAPPLQWAVKARYQKEEQMDNNDKIPKTDDGEPEAGLQKGMLGRDYELRPKGKGELVQITLDDYLALLQYQIKKR